MNLTLEAPDEYEDESNVDVFVVREHEAPTQVCVDKNEEPALRMTVTEVRQMIAALQSALLLAETA